jgi:CelD/BcsL family acetyltransferase involved in cellulose biosynthesis
MTAAIQHLRFQVGARTLAAVPRRLHRVGLSLDQVLAGEPPALPPLAPGDQGWLLTSVPETLTAAPPGFVAMVRQRYERHHLDLAAGEAAWLAGLSANARSGIKRKRRKLAEANGGTLDVRRYHDPDGFAAFHPLARTVSARTYQERLLDAGLPADPAPLLRRAAAGKLRAWLLFLQGQPIAYLACTAQGTALRYDHVGHDPAWNALSPGAVLQAEALGELFGDRFARFDFTEGEGQHKRQFASGSTACVDLLILRPTLANRAVAAALAAWDGTVSRAKASALLRRIGERLRR